MQQIFTKYMLYARYSARLETDYKYYILPAPKNSQSEKKSRIA